MPGVATLDIYQVFFLTGTKTRRDQIPSIRQLRPFSVIRYTHRSSDFIPKLSLLQVPEGSRAGSVPAPEDPDALCFATKSQGIRLRRVEVSLHDDAGQFIAETGLALFLSPPAGWSCVCSYRTNYCRKRNRTISTSLPSLPPPPNPNATLDSDNSSRPSSPTALHFVSCRFMSQSPAPLRAGATYVDTILSWIAKSTTSSLRAGLLPEDDRQRVFPLYYCSLAFSVSADGLATCGSGVLVTTKLTHWRACYEDLAPPDWTPSRLLRRILCRLRPVDKIFPPSSILAWASHSCALGVERVVRAVEPRWTYVLPQEGKACLLCSVNPVATSIPLSFALQFRMKSVQFFVVFSCLVGNLLILRFSVCA